MFGTRFLVLQMKDLIKIGAIVLLGILLIILALVFLTPNRGGNQQEDQGVQGIFVPGTYASTIILNNKPVEVRVTVSEDEILSIYMTDMEEIQRVFFPLFEPRMYDLAAEILRHQSAYIDPATDYPVTTDILQRAVKAALDMARLEH